jgi:hypothetical protein
MLLSLKPAANKSHAEITLDTEKPPAFAARSAIPPSIFDLSSLLLGGGSSVAAYSKIK